MQSNGCEASLSNDVDNCGFCHHACAPVNNTGLVLYNCSVGACIVTHCPPGFGACNGIASDGARNIVFFAFVFSFSSSIPPQGCATNLLTTLSDCGACSNDCVDAALHVSNASCSNGTCSQLACIGTWRDCDGLSSDGCETDVSTSASDCGACGRACALPNVAVQGCLADECIVGACPSGRLDCDTNATNGCEFRCAENGTACTCESNLGLEAPINAAAIGGGVAGGLVFLALIGLALFFLGRRLGWFGRDRLAAILAQLPEDCLPYLPVVSGGGGGGDATFRKLELKPTSAVRSPSFPSLLPLTIPILSYLIPIQQDYRLLIDLLKENLDGAGLLAMEGAIVRAWSVFNAELASNFVTQRGILERRSQEDPGLFRKTDWERADRQELRERGAREFKKLLKNAPWYERNTLTPLVPMVHGTSGAIAWKIANNGFSALSALDAGYYGRHALFMITISLVYFAPLLFSAVGLPCPLKIIHLPSSISLLICLLV